MIKEPKGKKEKKKKNGRRRYYRYGNIIFDCIIAILGAGVIVTAVILFLNFNNNIDLSPFVFALAAAMNLALAVKYAKRHEKGRFISFLIQMLLLAAISIGLFIALHPF